MGETGNCVKNTELWEGMENYGDEMELWGRYRIMGRQVIVGKNRIVEEGKL